ncbi:MAG: hypothetical protein V1875_00110 [Candidatus Altiarchaeota archaeon]
MSCKKARNLRLAFAAVALYLAMTVLLAAVSADSNENWMIEWTAWLLEDVLLAGIFQAIYEKMSMVVISPIIVLTMANPCVWAPSGACDSYVIHIPYGDVTWSQPLDQTISIFNARLIMLLQMIYVLAITLVGMYLIFMAGSPQGRNVAKETFIRLMMGMILVSMSPLLFQLFGVDIVRGVTTTILNEASSRPAGMGFMGTFFSGVKYLCTTACFLSIGFFVAIIVAFRYFLVFVAACFFPLTMFFYFTDIPNPLFSTRGLGTRMLRATILLFVVQLIQVMFLAMGLGIASHSGGNIFGEFLLMIACYAGILASPLVGMQLLAWVGTVIHVASGRPGSPMSRFISTWMRTGRISSALTTASGQYMIGHNLNVGGGSPGSTASEGWGTSSRGIFSMGESVDQRYPHTGRVGPAGIRDSSMLFGAAGTAGQASAGKQPSGGVQTPSGPATGAGFAAARAQRPSGAFASGGRTGSAVAGPSASMSPQGPGEAHGPMSPGTNVVRQAPRSGTQVMGDDGMGGSNLSISSSQSSRDASKSSTTQGGGLRKTKEQGRAGAPLSPLRTGAGPQAMAGSNVPGTASSGKPSASGVKMQTQGSGNLGAPKLPQMGPGAPGGRTPQGSGVMGGHEPSQAYSQTATPAQTQQGQEDSMEKPEQPSASPQKQQGQGGSLARREQPSTPPQTLQGQGSILTRQEREAKRFGQEQAQAAQRQVQKEAREDQFLEQKRQRYDQLLEADNKTAAASAARSLDKQLDSAKQTFEKRGIKFDKDAARDSLLSMAPPGKVDEFLKTGAAEGLIDGALSSKNLMTNESNEDPNGYILEQAQKRGYKPPTAAQGGPDAAGGRYSSAEARFAAAGGAKYAQTRKAGQLTRAASIREQSPGAGRGGGIGQGGPTEGAAATGPSSHTNRGDLAEWQTKNKALTEDGAKKVIDDLKDKGYASGDQIKGLALGILGGTLDPETSEEGLKALKKGLDDPHTRDASSIALSWLGQNSTDPEIQKAARQAISGVMVAPSRTTLAEEAAWARRGADAERTTAPAASRAQYAGPGQVGQLTRAGEMREQRPGTAYGGETRAARGRGLKGIGSRVTGAFLRIGRGIRSAYLQSTNMYSWSDSVTAQWNSQYQTPRHVIKADDVILRLDSQMDVPESQISAFSGLIVNGQLDDFDTAMGIRALTRNTSGYSPVWPNHIPSALALGRIALEANNPDVKRNAMSVLLEKPYLLDQIVQHGSPQLRDAAMGIIRDNIGQMMQTDVRKSGYLDKDSISLVKDLAIYGKSPEEKASAIGKLVEGMYDTAHADSYKSNFYSSHALGKVILKGDDSVRNVALTHLLDASKDHSLIKIGDDAYASRSRYAFNSLAETYLESPEDVKALIRPAISAVITQSGLDVSDTLLAWDKNVGMERNEDGSFKTADLGYGSCLNVLSSLNAERPGAAKYLHEKYGLTVFGRYTSKTLMHIYDQDQRIAAGQEAPKNLGLIVLPQSDWNGAFLSDAHTLEKLVLDGGARIVEAETAMDLGRALITHTKKFGPMPFFVGGGHGTPNGVQIGENTVLDILNIENSHSLARPEKQRRLFTDNPTIILASCSTGADVKTSSETRPGFGQTLSQKLEGINAKVIAPDRPTGLQDISFRREGDRLEFEVKYSTDARKEFVGGKALPSSPDAIKKYLLSNPNVSDSARIGLGERLLGRRLNENERTAVLEAHELPGAIGEIHAGDAEVYGKGRRLLSTFREVNLGAGMSQEDARAKARREAQLILDAGIAGKAAAEGMPRAIVDINQKLEHLRNWDDKKATEAEKDSIGFGKGYSPFIDAMREIHGDKAAGRIIEIAEKIRAEGRRLQDMDGEAGQGGNFNGYLNLAMNTGIDKFDFNAISEIKDRQERSRYIIEKSKNVKDNILRRDEWASILINAGDDMHRQIEFSEKLNRQDPTKNVFISRVDAMGSSSIVLEHLFGYQLERIPKVESPDGKARTTSQPEPKPGTYTPPNGGSPGRPFTQDMQPAQVSTGERRPSGAVLPGHLADIQLTPADYPERGGMDDQTYRRAVEKDTTIKLLRMDIGAKYDREFRENWNAFMDQSTVEDLLKARKTLIQIAGEKYPNPEKLAILKRIIPAANKTAAAPVQTRPVSVSETIGKQSAETGPIGAKTPPIPASEPSPNAEIKPAGPVPLIEELPVRDVLASAKPAASDSSVFASRRQEAAKDLIGAATVKGTISAVLEGGKVELTDEKGSKRLESADGLRLLKRVLRPGSAMDEPDEELVEAEIVTCKRCGRLFKKTGVLADAKKRLDRKRKHAQKLEAKGDLKGDSIKDKGSAGKGEGTGGSAASKGDGLKDVGGPSKGVDGLKGAGGKKDER